MTESLGIGASILGIDPKTLNPVGPKPLNPWSLSGSSVGEGCYKSYDMKS